MTDPGGRRIEDVDLERMLARRVPKGAPTWLVDRIARTTTAQPQARLVRIWFPVAPDSPVPHGVALVGLVAAVVLLLLVAILAAGRAKPQLAVHGWLTSSLGSPGSRATAVGVAGGAWLAAVQLAGVPARDEVWRSIDGQAWQRIADEGPFAGSTVRGFLGTGSGILAYGSRTDEAGHETLATWSSSDGSAWRLLAGDVSTKQEPGGLIRIVPYPVASGLGYVGVGTRDGGTAAWSSRDGRTWIRAVDDIVGIEVLGVVRSGGNFVALTRIVDEGIYAWISNDGVRWTRGTLVSADACCGPTSMTNLPGGTPGGILAVGAVKVGVDVRPYAWTSANGEIWRQVALPLPADATCDVTESWPSCPVVPNALAADGLHIVIAGSRSTGADRQLVAELWTSRDGGGTWSVTDGGSVFDVDSERGDDAQFGMIDAMAGGPNAFMITGSTRASGAVVWFGRPFPQASIAP